METINATDAKREFGEVLLKVQNSPVSINKNGKPVVVVFSAKEYEELSVLKAEWLKAEISKGIEDLKAGNIKDGKSVIANLRKRIMNV